MSHTHHKPTANEQIRGVTFTKGANPSNTHKQQAAFFREFAKRLKELKGLVRTTVGYENDALFLKADATPPSIAVNADDKEAFDFPRVETRINRFMRTFRQWLQELLLDNKTVIEVRDGQHWSSGFLKTAYITGVKVAQGRLMSEGVSLTSDTPDEITNRPTTVRELQRIYKRAFEQLQGFTDAMAQTTREELTQAIADGENPRKVANRLTENIQSLTDSRAATIARTEIINSHADATLNEYEQAGVDTVSHTSRLTAQDTRVCPFCRALEDIPFTLSEFQNTSVQWGTQIMRVGVPAHPSGRCSPMPEIGLSDLAPLEERIPDTIRGKPVTIL